MELSPERLALEIKCLDNEKSEELDRKYPDLSPEQFLVAYWIRWGHPESARIALDLFATSQPR